MAQNVYKIDFHTHSILSRDGGITQKDYQDVLDKGILDQIAITDHHSISLAKQLHENFGDSVIIGEEMTTNQGHVIGLFLTKVIPSHEDIKTTIRKIKEQKGIVYIPHPFDNLRNGIGKKVLEDVLPDVDIIEGFNARVIFKTKNNKAEAFARNNKIAFAAGSDSHVKGGLGSSYVMVPEKVNRENIKKVLANPKLHRNYQKVQYFVSPKLNILKKYFQ